jgi:hypothetical protein
LNSGFLNANAKTINFDAFSAINFAPTVTNSGGAVNFNVTAQTGGVTVNPSNTIPTNGGSFLAQTNSVADISIGSASFDTAGAPITFNSVGNINVVTSLTSVSAAPLLLQLTGGVGTINNNTKTISNTTGSIELSNTGATQSILTGNLNASNITLTSDNLVFTDGLNSISGTGSLLLQPFSAATSIDVGTVAGGTGQFVVDTNTLADGFSGITIGRADGQHDINVGDATFSDVTLIQAPVGAGSITVNGNINLNAGGNIDFQSVGPTLVQSGSITSAGGNINITEALQINAPFTVSTGAGAGNISLSTIDTAGTPVALTLEAGTGDITIGNVGASITPSTFTISSANNVTTQQIFTTDTISITANNINLNGPVSTLNNVLLAGNTNLTSDVTADLGFQQTTGNIQLAGIGNTTITSNGAGSAGIVLQNVDGNESLTLLSTGGLTFGNVGATTALAQFNADVGAGITSGSITAVGDIQLNSDALHTLNGGITSTNGNIAVRSLGDINQTAGTLNAASGGVEVTGANVTLTDVTAGANSIIGNTRAIKITASQNIQLGSLNATTADGLVIDVDPINIDITGSVTSSGDILLTASNDISFTGGNVTADSNGTGGGDLIILADSDSSGIGNVTATSGITLSGENASVSGAFVTTDPVVATTGTVTVIQTELPPPDDGAVDNTDLPTTDQTTSTAPPPDSSTSTGGGFDNTASAPAPDAGGDTTTDTTSTGDTSTSGGGDPATAEPAPEPSADSPPGDAPAEETAGTAEEPAGSEPEPSPDDAPAEDAPAEEAVAEEGSEEEPAAEEGSGEETKEEIIADTEEEAPLEEQPLIAISDAGDGGGQACTP